MFVPEPSIQDSYGLHRNNQTENYPQGNFTKPGERYRRLVPYMTYYLVGNNNVENQPPRTDKYEKIRTPPRKPQFHIRPRERNKQQTKNEPFLPSVQYDPKDTGPNKAYFTPIRYGMKLNQRDYSSNTRPVHSRPAPGNIVPETKFYKTETPNLPKQNYLPFRQTLKTVPTNIDYFLDYEPQSLGNQQSSYDYDLPFDEFESFRYATPAPDKPEYVNTINSQANNHLKVPVSELDHIVKSLQLSNHLPEMLNKDNIDSSIRTLVEILNILHNARSQPPRQQQQQEVQLQEHEVTNPKLKSKPPDYGFHEDFPRPHQVLQTNYYVTPNIRPQFQSQPIRNENTKATYYVSEQPARDKYKPIFPHEQTVDNQAHKQHSENTLENERFRYPINNEKTRDNYPLVNNGQKDNTENIPPSLKYGATRGKPHVDYPAYSTIPLTNFNCKQQRYKGFFGDPATRCQVYIRQRFINYVYNRKKKALNCKY